MRSFLDLACFTSQKEHFPVELILLHQKIIDRGLKKTAFIILTALYYSMS